jgi:hypothetical protein
VLRGNNTSKGKGGKSRARSKRPYCTAYCVRGSESKSDQPAGFGETFSNAFSDASTNRCPVSIAILLLRAVRGS